jgi:hypothetical protein
MKRIIFTALIVFLVYLGAEAQPFPPNPISPTGTIHTQTPLFDWTDVTSAISYRLQVITGVSTVFDDSTTVSQYLMPPGVLLNNTTYYWRVSVRTASGVAWSIYVTFNIIPIPDSPVPIYPTENAVICTNTIMFDWTDVAGAQSYRIQVSADSNFTVSVLDVSGLVNSGYPSPPETFNSGYIYYWRVNASSTGGTSAWSVRRRFTMSAIPGVPVFISGPTGNIGTLTPYFSWNSVLGAFSYRLQLSQSPTFTSGVYDTSVSGLSATIRTGVLSYNIMYYYRLSAINNCGQGNWTTTWSFTVIPSGINRISGMVPEKFKLYGNYPNPFNSSSKIKIDAAKLSDVRVIVYDILGRDVQTLVNEKLQPGTYETTFDGSGLNSGIYYYIMRAGDYSETKKMILIK